MGQPITKSDSIEKKYMDIAVDIKGRLDQLELFLGALVRHTEAQTDLVKALLDADARPQLPTQGGYRSPSVHYNKMDVNSSYQLQNEAENMEIHTSASRQKRKTRSAKDGQRSQQEHTSMPNTYNTHMKSNEWKESQKSSSSRNQQSMTPMETDLDKATKQAGFKIGPGSDEFLNTKQCQGPHEHNKNTLLNALANMQKSTVSQAYGLYQSIQQLQARFPEEISKQQTERDTSSVDYKKLVYQIKVLDGAYAKHQNPILCKEEATETDFNGEYIDKKIEENAELYDKIKKFEIMHETSRQTINRLEQELNSERSQATERGSGGFWPRWASRAPPPRKKAMVQMYCRSRNEKLDAVSRELEQLMTTQFDSINYDLTCTPCDKKEQLNTSIPVIVLCINASRLGTDVATSLEGLGRTKNICVCILHHKDTHALPKQPSHRLLTGTEYKSLGGIIDMAFLASKGVYPCDMNQAALFSLMAFIKGE